MYSKEAYKPTKIPYYERAFRSISDTHCAIPHPVDADIGLDFNQNYQKKRKDYLRNIRKDIRTGQFDSHICITRPHTRSVERTHIDLLGNLRDSAYHRDDGVGDRKYVDKNEQYVINRGGYHYHYYSFREMKQFRIEGKEKDIKPKIAGGPGKANLLNLQDKSKDEQKQEQFRKEKDINAVDLQPMTNMRDEKINVDERIKRCVSRSDKKTAALMKCIALQKNVESETKIPTIIESNKVDKGDNMKVKHHEMGALVSSKIFNTTSRLRKKILQERLGQSKELEHLYHEARIPVGHDQQWFINSTIASCISSGNIPGKMAKNEQDVFSKFLDSAEKNPLIFHDMTVVATASFEKDDQDTHPFSKPKIIATAGNIA